MDFQQLWVGSLASSPQVLREHISFPPEAIWNVPNVDIAQKPQSTTIFSIRMENRRCQDAWLQTIAEYGSSEFIHHGNWHPQAKQMSPADKMQDRIWRLMKMEDMEESPYDAEAETATAPGIVKFECPFTRLR